MEEVYLVETPQNWLAEKWNSKILGKKSYWKLAFGWLNETRLLEWEMEESGARIWAMTLTDEKKMLVKKVASFLIKEKSMWSLKYVS